MSHLLSITSCGALFGVSSSFAGILAIAAVVAAILFFGVVLLFSARYKRCPSNKIMVIFGRSSSHSSAQCIHGGAKFIVPLLQDYAYLSLEPMQIEIPLRGALSMENISVNVPSVFSIAIGTTPELMQNAAIRLLGMPKQAIAKQAEDVIFGQLRQVIASMRIDEINRDREAFLSKIQESLEPELRKLGLILINVNVTDITATSKRSVKKRRLKRFRRRAATSPTTSEWVKSALRTRKRIKRFKSPTRVKTRRLERAKRIVNRSLRRRRSTRSKRFVLRISNASRSSANNERPSKKMRKSKKRNATCVSSWRTPTPTP